MRKGACCWLSLSLPRHRLSPSLERRKGHHQKTVAAQPADDADPARSRFLFIAFDCGRQRTVRITQTPRLSVHDLEIVRTLA
jgi:hypothetical protein